MADTTDKLYRCCNTCIHKSDNFYQCDNAKSCYNGFSAYSPNAEMQKTEAPEAEAVPALSGQFVHERGEGWVGIAYQSESVGITVFIRRDTDLGVRDCNDMMERISRMSEAEKLALVMR